MLKPSSLLPTAVACLLGVGAAFAELPAKPSDALPPGGSPVMQALPSSAGALGNAAKPMQDIQANNSPVLQALPSSAAALGNAAKPTQDIQANNSPPLQALPTGAEALGNAAKPMQAVPATSNLVPQDVPNKDAALRPSNAVAGNSGGRKSAQQRADRHERGEKALVVRLVA